MKGGDMIDMKQSLTLAITPEEMRSFGFEMDCGCSFEQAYKQSLGDLRGLEGIARDIDDPLIDYFAA